MFRAAALLPFEIALWIGFDLAAPASRRGGQSRPLAIAWSALA